MKKVSSKIKRKIRNRKKLKDVNEEDNRKSPTNVTNALFVGSTAELAKMIKESDLSTSSK